MLKCVWELNDVFLSYGWMIKIVVSLVHFTMRVLVHRHQVQGVYAVSCPALVVRYWIVIAKFQSTCPSGPQPSVFGIGCHADDTSQCVCREMFNGKMREVLLFHIKRKYRIIAIDFVD